MDDNNTDDIASCIINYNDYLDTRVPLRWSELCLPPGSIIHKSRPKEIDIDKPTHGHILERRDESEDYMEQTPHLDDMLQNIYMDVAKKTSERCASSASSEQGIAQQANEMIESVSEELSEVEIDGDRKSRSTSGTSTSSSAEDQDFELPKKFDYPFSDCSATAYRKSDQSSESQPSSQKASKSKKKNKNEKRKKLELQPFLESIQAEADRNRKDLFLESVQQRKREREAEMARAADAEMAKLQNEHNAQRAMKLSQKSDPQSNSKCGAGFWEDTTPQPKIEQSHEVVETKLKPPTKQNTIIMENISVDTTDDDIEGCMSGYGNVKSLSSQVYDKVKIVELVLESDVDVSLIISWMETTFEGSSDVKIYCKD